MFCEVAAMQLSGTNLLIASQQAAKQAAIQPQQQAAFAAALKTEKAEAPASFEPLQFKAADLPAKPASTPAAPFTAGGRPGSNIDIRV